MNGYVIPADRGHAKYLLNEGLRQEDLEDVADLGLSPEDALYKSFDASFPMCFTVMALDSSLGEERLASLGLASRASSYRPVGMFGVVPTPLSGGQLFGRIWMLATPSIKLVRKGFLQQFPSWIQWLCEPFDSAGNDVYEKNSAMVQLLQDCGFEIVGYSTPRLGMLWRREKE